MDDGVRRCVDDDKLYLPTIKRHSLQKIALHNRYVEIFATGMKNQWPQRAYIGLYCGAGRALVAGPDEIVETSALAVLRLRDPFTHYVYVDNDENCVGALRARVDACKSTSSITIIHGDVNERIAEVRKALPQYERDQGLLSFCFIDPFDLQLKFSTIKALAHLRMDVLVLLMVAVDGRRNFRTYLQNEESTRIGDFIDCPDWRNAYRESGNPKVVHFLMNRFDDAMMHQGYLSAKEDLYPVKVHGKNVLQYILAFYSKHPMGQKFWRQSRSSVDEQLGFNLG